MSSESTKRVVALTLLGPAIGSDNRSLPTSQAQAELVTNAASLPQLEGPSKRTLGRVLMSLLLCAGCGAERAAEPRVLRGGDSLIERLSEAREPKLPASNLPSEVCTQLRDGLVAAGWTLEPERWSLGEPIEASSAYRRFFPGDVPLQRWRCDPDVSFALEVGELWLEHDGATIVRRDASGGPSMWFDQAAGLLFSTRADGNVLLAFGTRAPKTLHYGYRTRARSPLRIWEPSLFTERPAPRAAQDLRGRLSIDSVDRLCLRVGAPSVLEWAFDEHDVDALELSIATVDQSFEARDGRLLRSRGGSDGMTFAVELESGGETRRLWSRHLPAGSGFEQHRVDLSAWDTSAGRLRLVTEGGPADDTTFDYGVWSGLRARRAGAAAPARPHLVLIDVDTLRADRLGCYGYERDTTPRLDAWVEQRAALFEDALATSNWTLPSTASMLTGLTVSQHGVTSFRQKLVRGLASLPLQLWEAGYETFGRSGAGLLSPEFGFNLGFEVFESRRLPLAEHLERGWTHELERLRSRGGGRPTFTFLQTYMTHDPYVEDRRFEDAADPYAGPLRGRAVVRRDVVERLDELGGVVDPHDKRYLDDIYDAGLRRMDDLVMDFIDGLDEVFAGEAYMVVLTSDHGEEILEHGGFGHGHSLHGEVLRVPLIVKSPDESLRGHFSQPVSLLDVAPTLLTAAGLEAPETLLGRSLLGDLPRHHVRVAQHQNDYHDEPAFAVTYLGRRRIEGTIVRADGDVFEFDTLFDLGSDPLEQHDLAATEQQQAAQLSELLHAAVHGQNAVLGDTAESELDADRIADLAALGYVDGG